MDPREWPRRFLRPLTRGAREVRTALAHAGEVSPRRQISVWSHGFYANHALLYDFDKFGFDAYVSDLQRATKLGAINRLPQRRLLDDKLVSFLYLRSLGAPTPEVHAFARDGQLVRLDKRDGLDERDGDALAGLLEERGRLVVKPRGGSGGQSFCLLEWVGERTLVNGSETTNLQQCLIGSVIVSDFVEQHHYAGAVFPHATNTIRLLTLKESDASEPFVASAIQRFGTERSRPVDNTSRGGLTASVDVETAQLGPLAALPGYNFEGPGPAVWSERHPDTDAQVEGVVVPYWRELCGEVCRVMATMHGCFCVGWDILVTPDGFSIIEGNNRPDVHQLQVHWPLLLDGRTRDVFAARGVLGRRLS